MIGRTWDYRDPAVAACMRSGGLRDWLRRTGYYENYADDMMQIARETHAAEKCRERGRNYRARNHGIGSRAAEPCRMCKQRSRYPGRSYCRKCERALKHNHYAARKQKKRAEQSK